MWYKLPSMADSFYQPGYLNFKLELNKNSMNIFLKIKKCYIKISSRKASIVVNRLDNGKGVILHCVGVQVISIYTLQCFN